MQPPKAAPNLTKLVIVPETTLEMGKELGSGAFGTVYKVSHLIFLVHINVYLLQGYWQPEGDAQKYTVAIKVMKEGTSAQSQNELLQVSSVVLRKVGYGCYILGRSYYGLH